MRSKVVVCVFTFCLWIGSGLGSVVSGLERKKVTPAPGARRVVINKRRARRLRRALPAAMGGRSVDGAKSSRSASPVYYSGGRIELENRDSVGYNWKIECQKSFLVGKIKADEILYFRPRAGLSGVCSLSLQKGVGVFRILGGQRYLIRKGRLQKRSIRTIVFPPIPVLGDPMLAKSKIVRRLWPSKASASTQWSTGSYGAMQLIGPPQVQLCQDSGYAWASRVADGGKEWLKLTYSSKVRAIGVLVYANWKPGAVVGVEALTGGGWVRVWSGLDPGKGSCPSISSLRFNEPVDTNSVRLLLNTKRVAGWNEIDTVQLVALP